MAAMFPVMRIQWLACMLAGCLVAHAEEKLPEVDAAIPAPVKALVEPALVPFPNGIVMAVSSTSEKAQQHVLQGMNDLNGGWEFEASRHFAAALKEDPDCLLAHWGMVIATLAPTPETGAARNASLARLLHLIDEGKGTELERGYAYGLIKYIEGGPAAAGEAFRKVSEKFPNEMEAAIFYALFTRSGYDELGTATPDQEKAEKILLGLIEKYPDSPLPLNALLTIRAEAPDLSGSLDMARKLTQMAPQYAPYHHLLGHYEWRCGNHAKAASAFGRASTLYSKWMKENSITIADCPELVRGEAYRIVAMVSKGDFDNAIAAAKRLANTPFPPDRLGSPGVRLLMWEAKTLPARILMRRGTDGYAPEALASLPSPEETKTYRDKSLSYWWVDALRISLEAQRLLDAGETEKARQTVEALSHHGEAMAKLQGSANALGERSAWNRAFRALEVIASEMRGRLVISGPESKRGTAYNWFRSATDRQRPSNLLLPPVILMPMAIRLGEYQLASGKPAEAVNAYQEALRSFPNDMNALLGLRKAYEKAHQKEKAGETQRRIDSLRAE